MAVSSVALPLWKRHETGLEGSTLLSHCLWPNGDGVKQAVSKTELRSREFTRKSWSTWLETLSKYNGFCYFSARGRKANTGASVVYRWRPKRRRQQHIRGEPGSGRSRRTEGIGAAGWLWTGRWKLFQGQYQEVPTQVYPAKEA